MSSFVMTREGLAHHLLTSIATAEGKDANSLPRDYVLPLIRDIVSAIDNAGTNAALRADRKIPAELFKPASAA